MVSVSSRPHNRALVDYSYDQVKTARGPVSPIWEPMTVWFTQHGQHHCGPASSALHRADRRHRAPVQGNHAAKRARWPKTE
jgi:hypothetical protein